MLRTVAFVALVLPGAALARDPNPGLWLPGAAPLGQGNLELAGGGGLVGSSPGLYLSADYAVSDQIALGALVPLTQGSTAGIGSIRALVYENNWSTLGAFAVGIAGPAGLLEGGAGLSFEGGWPTVRVDASVPLVFTPTNPLDDPGWAPSTLSEAGLTARIGPHAVRAGVCTAWAPVASYRYNVEDVWFEARYAHLTMGWLGVPTFTIGGGIRFGSGS